MYQHIRGVSVNEGAQSAVVLEHLIDAMDAVTSISRPITLVESGMRVIVETSNEGSVDRFSPAMAMGRGCASSLIGDTETPLSPM